MGSSHAIEPFSVPVLSGLQAILEEGCMNRKLTSRSSVENFKREAKRWLRALREKDADAHARLAAALPHPPTAPTLRDVQHALAREYGFDGWSSLCDGVGARPSTASAEDLTAFFSAAQENDVARLSALLDAHPDLIDARGPMRGHTGSRTAMHFGNHHYDVVKLLLERGADPNIRDDGDNAYPLHFVAERLELATTRLLVEHGADPIGEGDMHQLGVIGWATCFNPVYLGLTTDERSARRRALVDYLLAHGGRHNIFSATAMGAIDDIRRIVREQPHELERPMDAANHRRHALHLAVVERRHESIETLLELGAAIEATDVAGLTPLDQASLLGDRTAADLLMARGARLGFPAAIALGRDVDRLLSENPHAIEPGGPWATLIVRAAEQADTRMLETLIRHGADVNTVDSTEASVDGTAGYTALHAAAFRGNRAAVDLLLANGASVTARDGRYAGTPAGWATFAKQPEIAARILAGPIDMFDAILHDRVNRLREIFDRDPGALNKRMRRLLPQDPKPEDWTKGWWTPLAMAVAHGYTDAVRELLALGADTGIQDPEGRSLREIALAEGHADIAALLEQDQRDRVAPAGASEEDEDARVARFLANACPDHHVRGGAAHIVARQTAGSLLARHPSIAQHDIYTAVVCGDLAHVERILASDPDAARRKGGAKGSAGPQGEQFAMGATGAAHPRWEPLLYLCFTRLDNPPSNDNAVAIAELLLEHSADPNAYFMAGDSRYSPLTGVIGEGEEGRPPHPRRDELTKLLLARGAVPYDVQVLYNLHLGSGLLWYLQAIYEETLKRGNAEDWANPEWPHLDMGGYGSGARYVLGFAVERNDLALARWALDHGATPNPRPAASRRGPQSHAPLHEEAVRRGFMDMAKLLATHGAPHGDRAPEPSQAFVDACLHLDATAARRLLAEHAELLASPGALHAAAALDRADVVAFTIDLGVSVNVPDPRSGNQLALHAAAWMDAPNALQVLIDRGGDVDRRDDNHGGTPLGFAIYGNKQRAIRVLERYGSDVWNLALLGSTDRLRAALQEHPSLARAAWPGEQVTALMRLPGDPASALVVAKLLVEHGADPRHVNNEGQTAIDLAERRGLTEVVEFLRGVP